MVQFGRIPYPLPQQRGLLGGLLAADAVNDISLPLMFDSFPVLNPKRDVCEIERRRVSPDMTLATSPPPPPGYFCVFNPFITTVL